MSPDSTHNPARLGTQPSSGSSAPAARPGERSAAWAANHVGPPLRVLVCDHRSQGLGGQLRLLNPGLFAFSHSRSLRSSLLGLNEDRPDAIILASAASGGKVELSALSRARSAAGGKPGSPVPLLIIAGAADREAALRADQILQDNLWDVVPESTEPEEIALRLRRLLVAARREKEMNDLRHRASHDDRTDLLRPKAFQSRLDEHFSAAKRHKYELALVLIDLDRFGQINKVHDHTVGDDLISKVGEVIRTTLRVEDAAGRIESGTAPNADDAAGRLGGDEFAVILPFTEKVNAALVVNRLLVAIKQLSGTPRGAKSHIDVSASIGFETFDGNDLDSLPTLRDHAEQALRVAKVQGGNQGVYFRSLEEN